MMATVYTQKPDARIHKLATTIRIFIAAIIRRAYFPDALILMHAITIRRPDAMMELVIFIHVPVKRISIMTVTSESVIYCSL